MTQANSNSITRRILLAGAAAAGIVPLAASTPLTADAGLIALGAQFERVWAIEKTFWEGKLSPATYSLAEDAHASTGDLAEQIVKLRATTMEGLRVKARVVAWCYQGEPSVDLDARTTDIRIAESIVHDLLAVQS